MTNRHRNPDAVRRPSMSFGAPDVEAPGEQRER
jgi:hypothetical protein